jgi:hypothetical protein
MKLSFYISGQAGYAFCDSVELDSRIPVPRIGEKVLLKCADEYYRQHIVTDIVHSYCTETIFIYVLPPSNETDI